MIAQFIKCTNQYLKGLAIARHNKVVRQITHALQSNKYTRFFTFTNARYHDDIPQRHHNWLLACSCNTTPCTCQGKLRLDILWILNITHESQPPIMQTRNNTLQFIDSTLHHEIFLLSTTSKRCTNITHL